MYRDAMPRCPRCAEHLEHRGDMSWCRACRGVCVTEPKLDAMLREMHDVELPPVFTPRAGAERVECPTCRKPMAAVTLEGVAVERCEAAHGVLFDESELEKALRAAAETDREPPVPKDVPNVRIGVVGGLLKALFG